MPARGACVDVRIVLAVAILGFQSIAFAQANPPKELAAIPPNKDTDLKFYRADGTIQKGVEALDHMTSDADLVLWVAGNQFFAMDEVVGAFQKTHPGMTVGLITLPPGLILSAIQNGGWTYSGKEYRSAPDVYASVNLGHLRQLKAAGLMSNYAIYMHNELQIMVAKGNPKKIGGIDDSSDPTSEPRCRTRSMKASCSSMRAKCSSGMACGRRSRTARSAYRVKRRSVTGSPLSITAKRPNVFAMANPMRASSGRPR